MRPELTAFQVEVEKAINEMLAHLHKHVTDRRIGIPAPFVTGSIRDQDITFWIYPDSVAFQAGRRHQAFERTDYTSLNSNAGSSMS